MKFSVLMCGPGAQSAVLFVLALGVASCGRPPEAGDPCGTIEDSFCESPTGPGIYGCLDGEYRYLSCSGDLCQGADERWSGRCGSGGEHDVCFCEPDDGTPTDPDPSGCSGPTSFSGSFGTACTPSGPDWLMCVTYNGGHYEVNCDEDTCLWEGHVCERPDATPMCRDGGCAYITSTGG